jgi:hypothetical protein
MFSGARGEIKIGGPIEHICQKKKVAAEHLYTCKSDVFIGKTKSIPINQTQIVQNTTKIKNTQTKY